MTLLRYTINYALRIGFAAVLALTVCRCRSVDLSDRQAIERAYDASLGINKPPEQAIEDIDRSLEPSSPSIKIPGISDLSVFITSSGEIVDHLILDCDTGCVEVEARVRGGYSPYVFEWNDPALQGPGPHQLCRSEQMLYIVTVHDSPIMQGEFQSDGMSATAELTLEHEECVDKQETAQTTEEEKIKVEEEEEEDKETLRWGQCDYVAPNDTIDPETRMFDSIIEWTWEGGDSWDPPLVANLTDDNADGRINLDDTPDIVVTTVNRTISVLDGASGTPHFTCTFPVMTSLSTISVPITPALGDIDNDGLVEIVAVSASPGISIVTVFENDGVFKWESQITAIASGVALADIDNDGDIEIVAGGNVFDHLGNWLWEFAYPTSVVGDTSLVDIDSDGDLEVVLNHAVYHHDNQLLYNTDILLNSTQVGNFDADPEPEILLTNELHISLLEHDGTTVYRNSRSNGGIIDAAEVLPQPATIHDFDGDGQAEYALCQDNELAVYENDSTIVWTTPVANNSDLASATAFDFMGDGVAELIFADGATLWVFDGPTGRVLLQIPRWSDIRNGYPVVADVDNDSSAELVVVSALGTAPTVQVIGDRKNRWVPARRIWNQHTYHVTNVNEDGTIPQFEQPHYQLNNTFRAQAQIRRDDGEICIPNLSQAHQE